jgi:hypothetical protein
LVYESGLSRTSKTFGVDVKFLGVSPGVVTRMQFGKIHGVVYVVVVEAFLEKEVVLKN